MARASQRIDSTSVGTPPSLEAQFELVEKAKCDVGVFGDLYELHYSAILNYFLRRTLCVPLAEELTSEVFFKALKGLPKFRNKVPIRAWLYRIAANELKMHWRKEKSKGKWESLFKRTLQNERISSVQPNLGTEEELAERLERHASLLLALDRLSSRYREALVLRYFEGLKYDEIALVLSKKLGTVKSLVHRGLAKLRSLLDETHATF